MGDNVIIKDIRLIQDSLYQIDLYNETKNEWYRTFVEKAELEKMLKQA